MTAPVRYRERADNPNPLADGNVEVEVFTPTTWGSPGNPRFHVVRYPDASGVQRNRIDHAVIAQALAAIQSCGLGFDDLAKITAALRETIPGREYIITDEQLTLHFEMLPQTLRVQAWGGVFERPMKSQIEAEEAANDGQSADP